MSQDLRAGKSGIYMITAPNGKRYIGQSSEIRRRLNHHVSRLKCGAHRNRILQNISNKYGVDSLKFEVLIYCDKDKLGAYEILAEKVYRPELNIGACGDSPMLGKKFSAEHRAKISASLMVKKPSAESISKANATKAMRPRTEKQILASVRSKNQSLNAAQLDGLRRGRENRIIGEKQLSAITNGRLMKYPQNVKCIETGEVFKNSRAAEMSLGKRRTKILDVCLGRTEALTAYGFHWEFC